ncbi:hypothetical protein A2U01_0101121, partial [Trifolium medium]|nr:hypothetical protein [Trifolium medium]
FECSRPVDL